MKKYALIVAGGTGVRMGSATPKQFLLINQKPVIYYSINAFITAYDDVQVIVILPKDHFNYTKQIQSYFNNTIEFVEGGLTRFDSVKNGLAAIKTDGVVFVHDAVRCLLSPNLIKTCFETCVEKGNAIPVINCVDSMRSVKDGNSTIIDRNTLKIVQTPQTFFIHNLKEAFSQNYQEKFTDEASVVESMNKQVNLCNGESFNIKITTPIDLFIAENILRERFC